MKKRIAKKMANRYLNNPKGSYLPYGIYTEGFQAYTDGRPAVIKTYARFPYMVKKIFVIKLQVMDGMAAIGMILC